MDTAARQPQSPENECPHCRDTTGICIAMRCLKCDALLCSHTVTPVMDTHPYYPYKHRIRGRWCGPVQPVLLPPGEL